MTTPMPPTPPSPSRWLTHFGKTTPGVWRRIDELRARFDWDIRCFCPLGAVAALVNPRPPLTPEQVSLYKQLAALAAWRATQGIYRFDPDVLDAVWDTEFRGPVPAQVLLQLPEWCPYIAFDPPRRIFDTPALGFWTHLNLEAGHDEWRALVDLGDQLVMASIPLLPGASVQDGLQFYADKARQEAQRHGMALDPAAPDLLLSCRTDFEGMLSLTLYLCHQNADILAQGGRGGHPGYPRPQRVKSGLRLFPPQHVTYWEVAYRMGVALRTARMAAPPPHALDGARQRPRPHVRNAHWHSYWLGPKHGEQTLDLRWMAPIRINAPDADALVPTLHAVDSPPPTA